MSVLGPSRHFAATHYYDRFRGEADIDCGVDCALAIQQRPDVGTRSTKLVPDYIPRNFGLRFSTKARRASLASAALCRMPPAFEVSTIVVSSELSSAARMMRFEFHCTSGG